MADITLSEERKLQLTDKLKRYCDRELDLELGQFDAEFLLDFIAREMGAHFYNQGLYDAQAFMQSKVDMLLEGIYEIEKPVV